MEIKRTTGLVFFIIVCAWTANASDLGVLNGIWLSRNIYNSVVNNPTDRHLNDLTMIEDRFNISWDETKKEGVFLTGMVGHHIQRMEILDDEIKMVYGPGKQEIIFKVVSHDVLQIMIHPYNQKYDYLYRIFDPAKPPIQWGTINDNWVRFRNKPELSSGVWYYLDFEERVEIIGRSEEKQKVGEMEEYWYEVCISSEGSSGERDGLARGGFFLSGWVYGAYIDIEDKAELEEKLKNRKIE
jgi:hypothetical protein